MRVPASLSHRKGRGVLAADLSRGSDCIEDCEKYLQFQDGEVGEEVVRAVVELLCEVVVEDIEVLRVVSVDARDELLDVLGSGGRRDPLGCAGGFGSHNVVVATATTTTSDGG